jgi:hypothetical protein
MKQSLEIRSIDEGMQIECSDEQHSNADLSSIETRQPSPNVTDKTEWQLRKDPTEIASSLFGIRTSPSSPKYRTSEVPLESSKKSPETARSVLSAATVTLRIPE